MASPAFHFAAQASLLKYSATAAGSVVATLDDLSGVDSVTWAVVSVDDSDVLATRAATIVLSGTKNSVCTLTAGAVGTAGILQCTVNGGFNQRTNAVDATLTTKAKFYVLSGNGLEVGCVNERLESNATHGWSTLINAAIRAAGGAQAETLIGENDADVIEIATFAGPLASVLKLDADDALQIGDVGDAGLVQAVDIRAAALARVSIGGDEALAITGNEVKWPKDVSSPTLTQIAATVGAGQTMVVKGQDGAAGSRGGHIYFGGGDAGTPGAQRSGDVILDLGVSDSADETARFWIKAANDTLAEIYSPDASAFDLAFVLAGTLSFVGPTIFSAPIGRSISSGSVPAGSYALSDASITAVEITGDITLTAPVAGFRDGADYQVHITQGGAGSFLVTWPTEFDWGVAGTPTLSTAVGARDVVRGTAVGAKVYVSITKGYT